jgi:hypothetical protein
MSDIHIDRLTLKLEGVSEADGRRLAMLVAAGLAGVALPDGVPPRTESIRLDLRARPSAKAGGDPHAGEGASMDMLAEQVVTGVLRELSRDLR